MMILCRSFVRHFSNMKSHAKSIGRSLNTGETEIKEALKKSDQIKSAYLELLKKSQQCGGEKEIKRHTIKNKKMVVHDRLKKLFDNYSDAFILSPLAGSAMEYGDLPSAGIISAIGKINGRNCLVMANDATVKGGTVFPICVKKQLRSQEIAYHLKLPCIYVVDSGGAFLPLQSEIFPDRNHGGRVFRNQAIMSALGIPQISMVCGSCIAGGAYVPGMSDQSIIVDKIGSVFLAGPPLVKAAIGEEVSEEELGGATLHCRESGLTDYFANTEEEAIEMCRDVIPTLNLPHSREIEATNFEQPLYPVEELQAISGLDKISKSEIYQVLGRLLDGSKFNEFKEKFGLNLVVGFGLIFGNLVGILANCGSLTSADALKGAHFVQLCEGRNIPLVILQNSATENNEDKSGNKLKDQGRLIAVLSTSNLFKITVNIGGCFGIDNYTMCGASMDPTLLLTWPGAKTDLKNAANIAEIEEVVKPKEKIDQRFSKDSAFYNSARMFNDGIILPEETRKVLKTFLELIPIQTLKQELKWSILRF